MPKEVILRLNDKEDAALEELCQFNEMSPEAVMRQALRHYQSTVMRLRAGETQTWSGDDQRARDFAGNIVDERPNGADYRNRAERAEQECVELQARLESAEVEQIQKALKSWEDFASCDCEEGSCKGVPNSGKHCKCVRSSI